MDNSLLYYGSLTLFGIGIAASNAIDWFGGQDLFSAVMVVGGIGLAVAASGSIVNGSYKEHTPKKVWTYLLATGSLLVIAGVLLRVIARSS